jgi:carboxylesterase type B
MHHLTAFGGGKPALFKKAVIQSPAYDAQIDRKGMLESQFKSIARNAGCISSGAEALACLRNVTSKQLADAQGNYIKTVPGGKPGLGPSADNDFSPKLPEILLAAGKVATGIESIINSHVADEAQMFVPAQVDDSTVRAVVKHYFGTHPKTEQAILAKFPSSKYADQKARIKALYEYSTFTCHNRFITQGFPGKTWNLQYSYTPGIHGGDVAANFYKPAATDSPQWKAFAPVFQSYLLSHAMTGDPNKLRKPNNTIEWPKVHIEPILNPVLNVFGGSYWNPNPTFELIGDTHTRAQDCDFWQQTEEVMTTELSA